MSKAIENYEKLYGKLSPQMQTYLGYLLKWFFYASRTYPRCDNPPDPIILTFILSSTYIPILCP